MTVQPWHQLNSPLGIVAQRLYARTRFVHTPVGCLQPGLQEGGTEEASRRWSLALYATFNVLLFCLFTLWLCLQSGGFHLFFSSDADNADQTGGQHHNGTRHRQQDHLAVRMHLDVGNVFRICAGNFSCVISFI